MNNLPIDKVMEWVYGCYEADLPKHARGGCPCGESRCEQWQMCVTPGVCGRYKLEAEKTKDVKKEESPILSMVQLIDDF